MTADLKQKLEEIREMLGMSWRFMCDEQSDLPDRDKSFRNDLKEYSKQLAVILPQCSQDEERRIKKIIDRLMMAAVIHIQQDDAVAKIRAQVLEVFRKFDEIEEIDGKGEVPRIENWKIVKVFVASPGDVANERRIIKRIIDKENDIHFHEQGYHIEPIGWQTDSPPDEQKWQNSLNKLIDACFLFVCVLWTRIGKYTKIEYEYALRRLGERRYPHILIFFSNLPLVEENREFREKEVRDFRDSLAPEVRHFSYDTRHDFEKYSSSSQSIETLEKGRLVPFDELFREHLGTWFYSRKRDGTFTKLSTLPSRKKDYSSRDVFRSFNKGDWGR